MAPVLAFRRTYFCFPNVVWASVSGAFRILSDKLVICTVVTELKDCSRSHVVTLNNY